MASLGVALYLILHLTAQLRSSGRLTPWTNSRVFSIISPGWRDLLGQREAVELRRERAPPALVRKTLTVKKSGFLEVIRVSLVNHYLFYDV